MQQNRLRTQRIKNLLDAWWQEQSDRLEYVSPDNRGAYIPCHKKETRDMINEIKRHLTEISKGNLEFEMYSNVDYGAESLRGVKLK